MMTTRMGKAIRFQVHRRPSVWQAAAIPPAVACVRSSPRGDEVVSMA